ncbi:MAG TPA: ABC transporter substrate-binding protein [Actinomycetota bacterium]|nr:ABC transporter substrate-binding protein [Actinomycetota bacterium]
MRRTRRYVLGAALLAFGLVLGACGSGGDDEEAAGGGGGGEEKGQITVGDDSFAESQIVAEMYAQVLEDAGYEVDRKSTQSREVRLPAMESGEIDVAPEYLATLVSVLDPKEGRVSTPEDATAALEPLLADRGLTVLEASDAVDTNVFVVTPELAERYTTISDLAPDDSDLTLGGPAECPKRPYCIPGLKDVYGIEFGSFEPLDYGPATVQALKQGAVDVALLFSTDGTIDAEGLIVLEDDQGLQAADNITPLVNEEVLNDEVEDLLNSVSAVLTTENVTELNTRVGVDQEDPADVAAEFLEEQGLL